MAFRCRYIYNLDCVIECTRSPFIVCTSVWRIAPKQEGRQAGRPFYYGTTSKSSAVVHSEHLKGLREIAIEHPQVGKRIVVSCVPTSRKTEDELKY